ALGRVLRTRGCAVHESATIAEAVDKIASLGQQLDVAVLDYFMPWGRATTALARAMERTARSGTADLIADVLYQHRVGAAVLFITAHTPETMTDIVRATRAAACLYKPFTAREFLQTFEGVCRWQVDRGTLLPEPAAPAMGQEESYQEHLFHVVLRLANVAVDDIEKRNVLRTIIVGTDSVHKPPHEICAMAPATYRRRKRDLQRALGITRFTIANLHRRIDHALASGELQPHDLLPL